jgi:serine/threonine protein kinase
MLSKKKVNHKTKYSKYSKYSKTKTLKGGKFLDKGGFGCVVQPALPCNNLTTNLNNYVSKIISIPDDDINEEIYISTLLKQIDPVFDYFVTIKDYCYISKLPSGRTNVVDVEYKDKNFTKYNVSSKLNLDKKYCHMDLKMKPINLILPFGGISLSKIMKVDRQTNYNIKSKIHQLFVTNIKLILKHLLIGIELMHRNKIVNRDIKQKNIMIYVEPTMVFKIQTMNLKIPDPNITKLLKVRYIDFGLSNHITSSLSSDINNINLNGTYRYISPELIISYIILKYKNKPIQYIQQEIFEHINKYTKIAYERIEETNIVNSLNENIKKLIQKILNLYENKKLLDTYFGINTVSKYNGFIYKSDVYALGITIFDTLQIKKYSNVNVRENKLLYDLLLKMIAIDPEERFNVVQCIHHPYFKT